MIVVFAYHSVAENNYRYSIAPELFERHLEFIKSKYQIIPLPELAEILKKDRAGNQNFAVITFDDGFQDNYTNAFPILKKMNIPATIFLATGLAGGYIKTSSGDEPMLTWQQISEMNDGGLIDFESHTASHVDLTAAEDTRIRDELAESKRMINEKLNKSVNFFAYPKGRLNERVKSIVGEYFYLAFAGNGIITDIKKSDKLALPRVTITNDIVLNRFKFMASPLYWYLRSFKKKLLG